MTNKTDKCSCGKPKKETKQFCDECWDFLPESARERIIYAGQCLHSAKIKVGQVVSGAETILRAHRSGKI
jgi:hypothetical protein